MSTFTFFVSILLGSTFANAEAFGKAASAQSSMSEEYIKSLMGDITKLQDFNKNFKINPKAFCPQYSGNDSSLCMKNYISSTLMKSSTEIVIFSTTVVGANLRDEKLGFSKDEIKILMVDNLLTLFEKVKVSDFRLAKLNPKTPVEKLEVQMLKKDDQKYYDTKW